MKNKSLSRRRFFQSGAMASAALSLSPFATVLSAPTSDIPESNGRKPWIAAFSTMGMEAQTPELLVEEVFKTLRNLEPFRPDILCLPETFAFSHVQKQTSLSEKVSISNQILEQFSRYASANHRYVICPVYIEEKGKVYIAAVLFDRSGKRIGDYKKIRVTDYEIGTGVTPGPNDPPVFQTDFGKIGIQICWDISWDEGWQILKRKGAEIVFWPSAFAGGKMINAKAWQHQMVIASCTCKDTSKICDITGDVIMQTGRWNPNICCASVNLDKVFINTWPFVEHFKEIQNKYGRKISITTFHEEEWTILESHSPEVNLVSILKEYNIPTYHEYLILTEEAENRKRNA